MGLLVLYLLDLQIDLFGNLLCFLYPFIHEQMFYTQHYLCRIRRCDFYSSGFGPPWHSDQRYRKQILIEMNNALKSERGFDALEICLEPMFVPEARDEGILTLIWLLHRICKQVGKHLLFYEIVPALSEYSL
jgi:hypothetical protein